MPVPFRRSLFLLALVAGSASVQAQVPQQPITVQVINDSGLPDSQVQLLLAGKALTAGTGSSAVTYPFAVSGVASIDITGTPPSAVSSGPLQCPVPIPSGCSPLAQAQVGGVPLTVTSPYSGQLLPVYEFNVTTISSGALYVSFNPPGSAAISYPPAPTVTTNLRYQLAEMTYSSAVTSAIDLTSIDFFGIPLQIETYGGTVNRANRLGNLTYYTSTPTLLQRFLNTSSNMSAAFWSTAGTQYTFNPAGPDLSTFARIVGPNQAAAAATTPPIFYPTTQPANWPAGQTWPPSGSQGSPWPYPSFASYLASLSAANYTFKEKDNKVISAYTFDYTGQVLPMTSGTNDTCLPPALASAGYYIKLTGITQGAASGTPNSMEICIPLPTVGAAATLHTDGTQKTPPIGSGDFVIYGAAQNCEALVLYSADGNNGGTIGIQACTDSNAAQLGAIANSIYGWIQADVLAALSFGYMNGTLDATYGNGVGHSAFWYGTPPVPYPFAAARATNDGYYNPWAAIIYNNSDAYGFAFSDRNGRPQTALSMPNQGGGTVRLWILPDRRLDAPQPTVQTSDIQSVTLQWPVVPAADHYVVSWSPPSGGTQQIIPQAGHGVPQVNAQITGLNAGSPYAFEVWAENADSTLRSAVVGLNGNTTGTQPATPAGNGQFNFSLNWTPPAYLGTTPTVTIGGVTASYSTTSVNGQTQGVYQANGLGINIGPQAAAASVVVNAATANPLTAVNMTASLSSYAITGSGSSTLTLTFNNPTSNTITMLGYALTLPPTVIGTPVTTGTSPSSCSGVTGGGAAGATIYTGQYSIVASGSCTLVVTVTPTSTTATGPALLSIAPMSWNSGSPPNQTTNSGVLALDVTGGNLATGMTVTNQTSQVGDTAPPVLQISVRNPSQTQGLTALQDFVTELPVGLTSSGLGISKLSCGSATLDGTGTLITLPAGSTIPPGGCIITANLVATQPIFTAVTAGPLLTNTTTIPTQAYPLTVTASSGTVLWSGTLYLSFLGSPWSYALGYCEPTDACIGGQAPPAPDTVPYSTRLAPNYLAGQSPTSGLSVAGGTQALGMPFDGAVNPAIGVSFAPVPDKRLAPVKLPPT